MLAGSLPYLVHGGADVEAAGGAVVDGVNGTTSVEIEGGMSPLRWSTAEPYDAVEFLLPVPSGAVPAALEPHLPRLPRPRAVIPLGGRRDTAVLVRGFTYGEDAEVRAVLRVAAGGGAAELGGLRHSRLCGRRHDRRTAGWAERMSCHPSGWHCPAGRSTTVATVTLTLDRRSGGLGVGGGGTSLAATPGRWVVG